MTHRNPCGICGHFDHFDSECFFASPADFEGDPRQAEIDAERAARAEAFWNNRREEVRIAEQEAAEAVRRTEELKSRLRRAA